MKTIFVAVLAFAIGVTAANLRAQVITLGPPVPQGSLCPPTFDLCMSTAPPQSTLPITLGVSPAPLPRPTLVQFPKANVQPIDDVSVVIGTAWAMGFYPTPDGSYVMGKNNQPGTARAIRVDAQGRVECAR